MKPKVLYLNHQRDSRKAHTRKVVDTMTKMTYAQALSIAINMLNDEQGEVAEKLTALKAQIEKKNSSERKPSKTQVANESLKGEIVEYLSIQDEGKSATEIAEKFGISNQKASALLTALVNDRKVVREVVKRKAYFKVG